MCNCTLNACFTLVAHVRTGLHARPHASTHAPADMTFVHNAGDYLLDVAPFFRPACGTFTSGGRAVTWAKDPKTLADAAKRTYLSSPPSQSDRQRAGLKGGQGGELRRRQAGAFCSWNSGGRSAVTVCWCRRRTENAGHGHAGQRWHASLLLSWVLQRPDSS